MSDSFVTPWTVAHQSPLSMGFPRQEYWSGLQLPPSGDFLDPGVKSASPAFHVDSLPLSQQRKPHIISTVIKIGCSKFLHHQEWKFNLLITKIPLALDQT